MMSKIKTIKRSSFEVFILAFVVLLVVPFSISRGGVITDAPRMTELVFNVLKNLLYLFGMLAIIGLVGNGLRYIFAVGDERAAKKAKELIGYCVIGIAIVVASLAVVKTISMIFGS